MTSSLEQTTKDLFDFSIKQKSHLIDHRDTLENRIYRILIQGQIRLSPLGNGLEKLLKDKIALSIKEDKPITLILATGWGKNWKSYSAPHLNWAEYFHWKFLFDYYGQISAIYKPGVVIEVSPDDYAVRIINRYKEEWLEIYDKELKQLMSYFNDKLPNNFQFVFNPSSNWFDYDKLQIEVAEEVENMKKDKKTVAELIEKKMNKAKNNVVQDEYFQNLSEEDKQKEYEESILRHDAWLAVDYRYRADYLEGGNHICVVHRKDIPGCLAVKNLEDTIVQYWKASGILVEKDGKYTPEIISPNKWNELESKISMKDITLDRGLPEVLSKLPILRTN